MTRKKKGPTTTINMRFPDELLREIEELVGGGTTEYADRTDLIKNATRKEVDFQKAKKERRIIQSKEP